ncbi:MAG: hypothetical protein ABSF66_07505 [Terriglobales bacterium]|jgi:hypothetical protein
MRASRRVWVVALVCLSNFCVSSFAAAQQSDQVIAERVLGPQWKQLSRRAGMIFAGTVLATVTPTVTTGTGATDRLVPGTTPAVQLSFRVDKAIAGVEQGQVLTIHEWAGAWSMHRPMTRGQHILIFLYPPSRLGLTSPVGGSLGQVALDLSGNNVSKDMQELDAQRPAAAIGFRNASSPRPRATVDNGRVSVVQLERAIRSAREE